MIQRLNQEKGITILISSHILSELYLLANRFGILDQGKIIREISKAEFETLSEDYIVLKTADQEKACQVLKEQIQLQFKVVNPENENSYLWSGTRCQTDSQGINFGRCCH